MLNKKMVIRLYLSLSVICSSSLIGMI